jgi:hypothetical protein
MSANFRGQVSDGARLLGQLIGKAQLNRHSHAARLAIGPDHAGHDRRVVGREHDRGF